MRICLLGSMSFLPQKRVISKYLGGLGHEVKYSSQDAHKMKPFKEWKQKLMKKHVKRIEWADSVIFLNLPRQMDIEYWVESYIGGNTLGEIFIAWYLGKKLYSWFEISEGHRYFEELDSMEISVWEPKALCKHPTDAYKKISKNYEICNICGSFRRIQKM